MAREMMPVGRASCRVTPKHLQSLSAYVLRQLRHRAASAGLHPSRLPLEDVIGETLLAALRRHRPSAGRTLSYRALREVSRGVVTREVARARERDRREVSLETPLVPARRIATIHPDEDFHLADVLADHSLPQPLEAIERGEMGRSLEAIFAELPDGWRETFFLHALDGLSPAEVASREARSVRDVVRAIRRTRRALRERLLADDG